MLPLVLAIVVLISIFWLIPFMKFVKEIMRQKQMTSSLAGPPKLPIIGNFFNVDRTADGFSKNIIKRANDCSANGHEVSCIWVLHRCFVTPLTGRAVKAILDSSEEIRKGNDYDAFLPWLGRGLLLSTGDLWRSRRRLLTPTFHFSQLDTYVCAMSRHAKVLVDEILCDRIGSKFDMYPLIKLCSLDIICETAMGKELNALHNPEQPYVRAVSRMSHMAIEAISRPVLWSSLVRRLIGHEQEFMGYVKIAREFSQNVIEERREALRREEVVQNKRAFLDMLLLQSDENGLSTEDLKDEVETFMFEGHDTTAAGLAWSIWCLACHPEIQEQAASEVASIFKDDVHREATREDLHAMPYLDRCIKEAMRLFPPVPVVMRKLQNDFTIGDQIVPRGVTVTICPLAIQRNEAVFDNAHSFDPNRFLPERSVDRHAFDYIPFSAGPRNCIGQRFASYEEKVVMSWLLRRYRFETDMALHDNPPLSEAVLRPKYGCLVTLHRR